MLSGKEFQIRGAACLNDLSQSVLRLFLESAAKNNLLTLNGDCLQV
jgi:hypothetical protein